MQEGIGEKIGIFVYFTTTLVAAIIISVFNGWNLTLVVVLSCAPIIIVAQSIAAKVHT
jgi:hypothetical protein